MAFTIKTIEGTGDQKQYWRIADDLIKRSRLYRHLCMKIYRACQKNGINKFHKNRYKEMYTELMKEFKLFERDANKILKKQDLITKKKIAEVEKLKVMLKRRDWHLIFKTKLNRISTAKNKKLLAQVKKVKGVETYLTKEFSWRYTNNDNERAEMMLRSIFGYEELIRTGKTTFHEIVLLSIGMQLDAFSRKEVHQRFGTDVSKYFVSQIKLLINKGYIRRFDRRLYYYITDEGRKKYEEILSIPYSRKYAAYWKGIFNEEK